MAKIYSNPDWIFEQEAIRQPYVETVLKQKFLDYQHHEIVEDAHENMKCQDVRVYELGKEKPQVVEVKYRRSNIKYLRYNDMSIELGN